MAALSAASALAGEAGVSILCYHHFEDRPLQGFSVKPADFAQQMDYLAANGFHVLKLSEVLDRLQGKDKSPFPERSVVITIDDGYKCAYDRALPVLRKHKFPATLFIYPGYIGGKGDKNGWDDYKKLQGEGLFDVQCHSYTHPNFAKMVRTLPPEKYAREMHHELFTSREVLEKRLGKPIDVLAYPYGIYDDQIRKWCVEAGYRAMLSVDGSACSRNTPPASMPRILVMAQDGLKAFARKAAALPLELEIVKPRDGEVIAAATYQVIANITDPDAKIESVRGMSAACKTGAANASSRVLTMSSDRSPKPGVHIVTITAADKAGRGVRTATWLFRSR